MLACEAPGPCQEALVGLGRGVHEGCAPWLQSGFTEKGGVLVSAPYLASLLAVPWPGADPAAPGKRSDRSPQTCRGTEKIVLGASLAGLLEAS